MINLKILVDRLKKKPKEEQEILSKAILGAIKHYVTIRLKRDSFKFLKDFWNNPQGELQRLEENAELWDKLKRGD